MSEILPTVTIVTENGPVVINESDFDPEEHMLYDPEAESTDEGDDEIDLDAMDRAELREVLDAHGIEYDGRAGEDKLREMARAAVFVNL